ncbi:MAG: hypothetical protein AB8B72_01930 [Crocinitomicaceae bacterium]
MSESILNNLYPEKALENISFLEETCRQINKDLTGFSSLKVELTEQLLEAPLQELINQCKPILNDLEASNNLQPFIYKVDLSEKKYISYKVNHQSKQKFAESIIERCAQKVYLRWYFSNRLNR